MNNLDKIKLLHNLYDIYQELLTTKQKEYFELYYFEDLSLAEIAIELNVSRNAVHNNLQATINHLYNYESKLKIVEKKELLNSYILELVDKYQIDDIDTKKIEELI